MFPLGAGFAVSVNVAVPPSVTAVPPATEIAGVPSSSVMAKRAVPAPRAPPERPVPLDAVSVPGPTVTVSDAPSSAMSSLATTVSGADAEDFAPPVKVMLGGVVVGLAVARFA